MCRCSRPCSSRDHNSPTAVPTWTMRRCSTAPWQWWRCNKLLPERSVSCIQCRHLRVPAFYAQIPRSACTVSIGGGFIYVRSNRGLHKNGLHRAKAREFRTAARHFLACGAPLSRVATFQSLLGAAQHSLVWGGEGLCTQNPKFMT